MKTTNPSGYKRRSIFTYILLMTPFVGLLWPGFYAFDKPVLAGFPFFYWYQLVWVFLGSSVVWGAYLLDARRGR